MSTLRRADHDAKTNTAPCCAAAPTVTASGVTGAVHARVDESARPRRVDKLREGIELQRWLWQRAYAMERNNRVLCGACRRRDGQPGPAKP